RSSGTGLIRATSTDPFSMASTNWSLLPTVTEKLALGKSARQTGDQRCRQDADGCLRKTEQHAALEACQRRTHVLDCQFQLPQRCGRRCPQPFAFLGEFDTTAVAREQGDAEVFLQ